jgi:hypothetical protein
MLDDCGVKSGSSRNEPMISGYSPIFFASASMSPVEKKLPILIRSFDRKETRFSKGALFYMYPKDEIQEQDPENIIRRIAGRINQDQKAFFPNHDPSFNT